MTTSAMLAATTPDRAEQALERALDAYAAEVATVAREVFAWLRRRLPGATLLVYDGYNALAVSVGPTLRASHAVLSVAVYPRRVSLFFVHGTALDDPAGLLRGRGRRMRHLVLHDAAQLAEPAVEALVAQAVARAPEPFPDGGGALVLRSASPQRRPRRLDT